MRTIPRAITATAAIAAFGILFIPAASACGDSTQPNAFSNVRPLMANVHNPLESASPDAIARDLRGMNGNASIVGMWSYQFIAQGNQAEPQPVPDGVVADFGYAQWHSDGTEITNSAGRAPATQNFCMGVWVKTGTYTYVLNHYAFTYDQGSGKLAGSANIQESVTLSPGGTKFSGTFSVTFFDLSGKETNQVKGQVMATRVTVDTAP